MQRGGLREEPAGDPSKKNEVKRYLPPFLVLSVVALCGASSSSFAVADPNSLSYKLQRHVALSPAALVGQKMFFDKSLSGSGKLACSTCHDPDHAYAPANGLAVQAGGKSM